jgi:hypothetical protein
VVRRHAVDHEGPDALLLEAACRAPERVPLRSAPVLAVYAAHAAAAAAEAEPHRQARAEEVLDGLVRRVADEREGLEQDEVGRVGLEGAREQADRLRRVRAVDVAVEAEGDGDLPLPARLGDRLAGEAHALARDVHPVDRPRRAPDARRAVAQGGRQRPRVGGDHVAARLGVASVHGADLGRRVEDRAQAPEVLLALGPVARDLDELRARRAVQHDAAVLGDEPHHPPVGAGRDASRSSCLRDDGL